MQHSSKCFRFPTGMVLCKNYMFCSDARTSVIPSVDSRLSWAAAHVPIFQIAEIKDCVQTRYKSVNGGLTQFLGKGTAACDGCIRWNATVRRKLYILYKNMLVLGCLFSECPQGKIIEQRPLSLECANPKNSLHKYGFIKLKFSSRQSGVFEL